MRHRSASEPRPQDHDSGDTTSADADIAEYVLLRVNTAKHLIIGYIFKRDEYPWVQNWGNFPENGKFARGPGI